MKKADLTLHDIEKWVIDFTAKQGWTLHPDKDLGKLTEEVGELNREQRRYDEGRERPDETDAPKDEIKREIASEIGDILFPLIKIATYHGISLEEAFQTHKEKMEERYKDYQSTTERKKQGYDINEGLKRAEEIATEAHKGVKDKGGTDYIEHPRRVAARMDDPIDKTIAWLHDVVEDTDWTIQELIDDGYPPVVTDGVDSVTKRDGETPDEYYFRVSQNKRGAGVKTRGDMQENMDLTRIPNYTEEDVQRVKFYKKFHDIVEGAGTIYEYVYPTSESKKKKWKKIKKRELGES